jgi:hypothetical protein
MVKVINVVFGIGIAILVYSIIVLGIKAFYPGPKFDDYRCGYANNTKFTDSEECYKVWRDVNGNYDKNVFVIANIAGVITITASLFLLSMINISAGFAFAGLSTIVYGYVVGWGETSNILKFFVGLVIAVIVIIFGVILNKKFSQQA